ncbi:MAG: EF-hand domain-containing protein, partial [Alphaproteobacteria bacterium]|nr:EF-hand domain-containing protein [Alphaproteobacteria bacterium]
MAVSLQIEYDVRKFASEPKNVGGMNSIANYRSIAGRCGGLPIIAVMMLGFASTAVLPDPALAQGKNPKKIIKKMDRSGDGKISRKEWRKSPDMFDS